jgi:hypothetical protein
MVSSLFLIGVKSATMRVQTVIEPKREETEMKITTIGLGKDCVSRDRPGRAGKGDDEA